MKEKRLKIKPSWKRFLDMRLTWRKAASEHKTPTETNTWFQISEDILNGLQRDEAIPMFNLYREIGKKHGIIEE